MNYEDEVAKFEASFRKDVAQHELQVIRDDADSYRHLRFKAPETTNQYFDIVTWPGYLALTGDMGSFVFTRLRDMFEFFRHDSPNYSYWAEKCVAQDRDGVKEFSVDMLRAAVEQDVRDHVESSDEYETADDDERNEAVVKIVGRIATETGFDGFSDAYEAHEAFYNQVVEGVDFSGSWEWNIQDFTHRFKWCCHALVYAVKAYDEFKAISVMEAKR